jgi:hypothetical protein
MSERPRRGWSMRMSYSIVLLLVPTANSRAQDRAGDPAARHAVCSYSAWSQPIRFESVRPLPEAIRFPTIALSKGQPPLHVSRSASTPAGYAVGVAGSIKNGLSDDSLSPTTRPPQLRAVRLDGRRFIRPGGGFWYAYPRAAVDDSGTLHVVWAEPDTTRRHKSTPSRSASPELRSVWHASLRDGRWSQADRIYEGRRLAWDEAQTSRLIVDARNTMHVAFVSSDSTGTSVIHLSATAASSRHWRSIAVRSQAGVSYLDLAVGADGNAAIALVTAVAFPKPRANVLALMRSTDGGITWTEPAVITEPEEEEAIEPHVFFDHDAVLRLEWVQQPGASSFVGGTVWHTAVTGSRRHSTSQLALPTDAMTSHSQAALDSCGALHLLTIAYPHTGLELRYARLAAGGWTAWTRPFDVPGGWVSIAAHGALVQAVWGSNHWSPRDTTQRFELVYSTLPIQRP